MDVFGKEYVLGALSLVPEESRPDVEKLCKEFDEGMKASTFSFQDGYGMYPGFSLTTAKNYRPRNGDVLVASYAKTGSTWTREIVRRIIYCKDQELLEKTKSITHLYAYLAMDPAMKYEVVDNLQIPRRIMATHLPAPLIDFNQLNEKSVKIIYVVRNPKDQAVSWFNFVQKFPSTREPPLLERFPQNEKEMHDAYLQGRHCFMAKEGEGYLEHVRDWWERFNDDNVMVLVFEKMKENLPREVRRLAEFIGVDLSDDEVSSISGATDINGMKHNSVSKQVSNLFIRRGAVGEWKKHLTVAQSEYVDEKVKKILGDTGIEFIYELND